MRRDFWVATECHSDVYPPTNIDDVHPYRRAGEGRIMAGTRLTLQVRHPTRNSAGRNGYVYSWACMRIDTMSSVGGFSIAGKAA